MLPPNHSEIAADFASHLGATRPATLTAWRLASQGMSDETIFATVACPQPHELVIRRFRSDGVARELTDVGRQFRLLLALKGTDGIPIADVLWHEPADNLLGAPFFVMRKIAGHVPVPWSPEGRKFLRDAGDGPIGQQFVDILARIHAVDWKAKELSFLP